MLTSKDEILNYIKSTYCYVGDVYERFRYLPEDQMINILDELKSEGKITIEKAVVKVV